MLSQMHKVYRAVAPVQTRDLFSAHFPPVIPDECISPHKIKLPSGLDSGLDPNNIIQAENVNSRAAGKLTIPCQTLG